MENSYTQTPVYNVLIFNLAPTSGGVTFCPAAAPTTTLATQCLPGGPPDPNKRLVRVADLARSGVVGTTSRARRTRRLYSLAAAGEAVFGHGLSR